MVKTDIVIIGAGLNGLAASLALGGRRCRKPLRVTLIERGDPARFADPAHDSRASALTAATQKMLSGLGVWHGMATSAQAMKKVLVTDAASPEARQALLSFLESDVSTPAMFLENHVIFKALLDEISQSPNITLMTGQGVSGFHFGPGLAKVTLADGTEIKASLVIGADGRGSPTRQAAGIGFDSWPYAQSAITLTVGHALPHGGRAEEHFNPQGVFAILPLSGNRSSLVWTEPHEKAKALCALPDEAFLAELRQRFGSHLGQLSLLSLRHAHPLSMMMAKSFVGPRLALLGDAAHVIHPLAGLGLNLGFKDAAALADCVMEAAALGQDIGGDAALEAYARWRRFDTQSTAAMMHGLHFLFANDHEALRLLRQVGLRMVDKLPALKRVFEKEAAGLTGQLPRLMRGLAA